MAERDALHSEYESYVSGLLAQLRKEQEEARPQAGCSKKWRGGPYVRGNEGEDTKRWHASLRKLQAKAAGMPVVKVKA